MTTLQTPFPSGMIEDGEIPAGTLAYFRERFKNRLHEKVLLEFIRQQDSYKLTKTELGRRIGKAPERITRLLAAPGNWTLDTVSDLLLGMGSELNFDSVLLVEKIAEAKQAKKPDATSRKAEPQSVSSMMESPRPGVPKQSEQHSGLEWAFGYKE